MIEQAILRLPSPTSARRIVGRAGFSPAIQGPGVTRQRQRFKATFDRLSYALGSRTPVLELRRDPNGLAPERALVFVTAGSIQRFGRVARDVGLEVLMEMELEQLEELPTGFQLGEAGIQSRTLYTTMPTLESLHKLRALWNSFTREESPPRGAKPWWDLFGLLLELRTWGPEDRLNSDSRAVIRDRLPKEEDAEVAVELEIWPTASAEKRANWRSEIEQTILKAGGRVVDRSSIAEDGFIYDAFLARLPVSYVWEILDSSGHTDSIATIEGIQFIWPQVICQSIPAASFEETSLKFSQTDFNPHAPVRGALLDGVPAAAHGSLVGGVIVEDLHDLVGRSLVADRSHATSMASLILRGDLQADGTALQDSKIVALPVLIDRDRSATSPRDRLFVDLVYTSLTYLFKDHEPLGPDVFVVNFSVGSLDSRFAGRISALAHLLDWWAAKRGVLFVISAGNVGELRIRGMNPMGVESLDHTELRQLVRDLLRENAHDRSLPSPAECLNGVTVGALSVDLVSHTPPRNPGIIALEAHHELMPQMTSGLGLGPRRSIKPDILHVGGKQEVRALPIRGGTALRPVKSVGRTGLVAAAPTHGVASGVQYIRGTSAAAALTTRAILQTAEALIGEGGPYEGVQLTRRELALLTRALTIHASSWPQQAYDLYELEIDRLGRYAHARAKEEVCRYFGHGVINPEHMRHSPDAGVTLVGLGSIRKDQAKIFRMPLPSSLSGIRAPRTMKVTLAWFSPVDVTRSRYRLASLEAVAADDFDQEIDKGWRLRLENSELDANVIRRGTVWSRRLKHRTVSVPEYERDSVVPIRVQCRDASNGGLSQDEEIDFAVAVTLSIEVEVGFDVFQEVNQALRVPLRPRA